jgi:alpha-tubulin suppressor-like RCC1 family protein
MAVKSNGTLWAWGTNSYGQIGNNTRYTFYPSPVQIGSGTDWSYVGAGRYHSLAVKTDGTLWGWGYNGQLQLGQSNNTDRSSPVQIGTDTNWSSAYGGNTESYALKSDGTVYGWGQDQSTGKLGMSRAYFSSIDGQWKQSSGALSFTVAIKNDGTLWGWGQNNIYQLGIGTTGNRSSPVQVGTDTNWAYVSAAKGGQYCMAIKTDGTLWGWGNNGSGNIGDGTTTTRSIPVQIGTDTNWKSVSVYSSHTLALKNDGTIGQLRLPVLYMEWR